MVNILVKMMVFSSTVVLILLLLLIKCKITLVLRICTAGIYNVTCLNAFIKTQSNSVHMIELRSKFKKKFHTGCINVPFVFHLKFIQFSPHTCIKFLNFINYFKILTLKCLSNRFMTPIKS